MPIKPTWRKAFKTKCLGIFSRHGGQVEDGDFLRSFEAYETYMEEGQPSRIGGLLAGTEASGGGGGG